MHQHSKYPIVEKANSILGLLENSFDFTDPLKVSQDPQGSSDQTENHWSLVWAVEENSLIVQMMAVERFKRRDMRTLAFTRRAILAWR